MATLIVGHGDYDGNADETFVPSGTTIKFYGDADEMMPRTISLGAVASGGLGSPNETFESGEAVPNYSFGEHDDATIAAFMQLDPGGNTLVFVGPDIDDDSQLCSDVPGCEERESHAAPCTGVLSKYGGDLIILACRGMEDDDDAEVSTAFGSDESDPLHDLDAQLDEWKEGFVVRAIADPDAAEREFDALPENSKAMVTNAYAAIESWNQARWVRHYADRGDFDGFVGQISSSTVDEEALKRWFGDVPVYADALFFLIVAKLRARFDDGMGALPSDREAAEAQAKELAEGMVGSRQRALEWIESTLGFSPDPDRLEAYGPYQELQAYVTQTLQQRFEQS